MTEEDIYTALLPIFQDIFDNDDIELTPELNAGDVDEWDSLSHIRLIVAVEKAMNVSFGSMEISALENVGQFVDLIQRKLAG